MNLLLNRKLVISAVAAMGLLATACGDDDDSSPTTSAAPAATTAAESTVATTAATATSAAPETTGAGATTAAPAAQGPALDASFGTDGVLLVPQSATDHDRFITVVEGPDGLLYASGFVREGEDTAASVTRLAPDGTVDSTFGTNGTAVVNVAPGAKTAEVARGLVVNEDGTIVIVTPFEKDPAAAGDAAKDLDIAVARLDSSGALDPTFGIDGITKIDLGAGKLAGETFLADNVWGLAARDGGYVAFGTTPNQGADRTDVDYALVGLDGAGVVDPTFGTDGVLVVDLDASGDSARNVKVTDDGSILATGYSRDGDGVVSPVLIKTDNHGVLDAAFGTGGVANNIVLEGVTESYQVVQQGENYILAGYGRGADEEEKVDMVVYRFLADGSLDSSFGEGGLFRLDLAGEDDRARNLALLPDGNILAIGSGKLTADDIDAMVVLLSPDGVPVETFGDGGHLLVDLGGTADAFFGVAVSADQTGVWLAGFQGATADTDERDESTLAHLVLS